MVSVIIPIYNTGEYLYACIQSVSKQTYNDLQIIMVDDGSCAETANICDEIAASDSRIEVIHKINEGVSIARNVGLEAANGDIICFVDSDDTIELNMIESLVDALDRTGAQIAMCDATTITSGKPDSLDTISLLGSSRILEKSDITPAMLTLLAGSAWRCAYRRTDMLSSLAKFPVGVKFSEDRIFNIIGMGLAERIVYVKESFYNRLIRKGSACFRFYPDMTEQIGKMRAVMLDCVRRYWGENYVESFERQIAGQIRYAITNYTASVAGRTLSQKFSSVRMLCDNTGMRECIMNSKSSDIRSRMILNSNYRLLTLIGILTNKIHKICKIGQYQ